MFHLPSFAKITNQDRLTPAWIQLFTNLFNLLNKGVPLGLNNDQGQNVPQSVVVPLAKLTGGGTNGSLTFTSGILTAYVVPT